MKMASVRRMKSCVLTVLLLEVFSSVVSSLYFHIGETETKCFIEEMPDETMIIANFWSQLRDNQRDEHLPAPPDLGISVVVKDPDDKLVLSQRYGSEGRFKFTSPKPGRYQICLQSSSSQRPLSAGGMLTVHLDIRVGERTKNYTEIAAKEQLSELQLRVRQLAEQVQEIQRQQDYQRFREKHFREVSHNTNMWIFWWPVVRSLYVIAIITWCTKSW
ncbi:transmembrane emp24 domain-containing protein 9-like [Siniperca chuatsi]|uniref:transmembrane emp24 domain-containing protein 9-like n=1 Tax=Siniperca chuatsi TaxID=119488 RepID=UPI001CE1E82E|nr:transmembrane emp24 domain-containing protein 9-like [Siniperca chuatsi]